MGWTIRLSGTDYDVVDGTAKRESILLAGGLEVDRQTAEYWESSTLTHGDVTIQVRWGPRNTVTACELKDGDDSVPLAPPAGSKAARREALARDHPVQFVLRRVGAAGTEIVFGVLGVSAILAAFFGLLLPRLDLPSVDLPSVNLPSINHPDWLRYLDPGYWLSRLGLSRPNVSVPGWIETVLECKQFWLPLVIAVVIALGEIGRRRMRDAEREAQRDDEQPGPDDSSPER